MVTEQDWGTQDEKPDETGAYEENIFLFIQVKKGAWTSFLAHA